MLYKNFIFIFSFILSLFLLQSCTDNNTIGINQANYQGQKDENIHFVFNVRQYNNCDAYQYLAEVLLWDADGNTVAGPTLTNQYGDVDWSADWPAGYYIVKAWYPQRPNNTKCIVRRVYFDGTDFYDFDCLETCDIEF
jgi:hypothetical protein